MNWSDTANLVVQREFADRGIVGLANGLQGVDASIGGAWAANRKVGIVLTQSMSLPAGTGQVIAAFDRVVIFGGETVVIPEVAHQITTIR